jgi:hypothetical protein
MSIEYRTPAHMPHYDFQCDAGLALHLVKLGDGRVGLLDDDVGAVVVVGNSDEELLEEVRPYLDEGRLAMIFEWLT